MSILFKKYIHFICFCFCNFTYGQAREYQSLLDEIFSNQELTFILKRPISHILLDNSEMWEYSDFIQNRYNHFLDTLQFSQIIKNSKRVDTTLWTENEIHNKILINERAEFVKPKTGIGKLGVKDKKGIKFYKKIISEFNSLDKDDRNIYYYSRPVFDDSKSFAIIQRDNGHSGLGGGGSICLYQFIKNRWIEVGLVRLWKY